MFGECWAPERSEIGRLKLLPGSVGSVQRTALVSVGVPVPALFPHPQHAELPGKHCRRRKARTVFSDSQLSGLEKRFEIQRYLSTPERVELATALSLSETQVGRSGEEAPYSASCSSPLSSEQFQNHGIKMYHSPLLPGYPRDPTEFIPNFHIRFIYPALLGGKKNHFE